DGATAGAPTETTRQKAPQGWSARWIGTDHLPPAIHLGQLDLVGPNQTPANKIDQVARQEVLPQEQLTGSTFETAKVDLAAIETHPAGLEADHVADWDKQLTPRD